MNEPPAAKGVTPGKVRYRPLSQTRNPLGWKVIALSIVGAVVAGLAFMFFTAKTVEAELEARGHFDKTVTIEPGKSLEYVMVRLVGGMYEFQVAAHDGPVFMAMGLIDFGESQIINPDDLKAILRNGVLVEAGSSHRMSGNLSRGRYYWAIFNRSQDKAVEVTIKFNS